MEKRRFPAETAEFREQIRAKIFSLPDNGRETLRALSDLGRGKATEFSKITHRSRATESAILNRPARQVACHCSLYFDGLPSREWWLFRAGQVNLSLRIGPSGTSHLRESYCNPLVSTRTRPSVVYGAPNCELREGKTNIHVNRLSNQRRDLLLSNPIRKLAELFDLRALNSLKNLEDSE